MFHFLHELIRAVYEGKSFCVLNSFIEGQSHTPKESGMVTPPWGLRFGLSTGRPQLIFYENELMMTAAIPEWIMRLTDLNAGKQP